MALLPILQFPDPRLRSLCTPVTKIDDAIHQLAADMFETLYAAPGRGLAAPQVGVLLRLFVIDTGWRDGTPTPKVCINPEILDQSQTLTLRTEGCLSIPDVPADVARPSEITLRWTDLSGAIQTERLTGIEATCAQHELDHLNGRLCIDLMDEAARALVSPLLTAMRPL